MKKVLIVQCNTLIKAEVFADLKKTISEDYKKTGIVFLPCDFRYEIVDVDEVKFEETTDDTIESCDDCIYYHVPYNKFPCSHCSALFIGPGTASYFKEKE